MNYISVYANIYVAINQQVNFFDLFWHNLNILIKYEQKY